MTRATLLRLLAHPTALNGADVRGLEELAEAFPYCQTAHLLLAKAAHDHGSMLAGQRLRRAATYATNRALLRQLLEAAPAEPTLEPATAKADVGQLVITPIALTELPTEASPAAPPHSLLLTDQPAQEIGPAPQAEAAPEASAAETAAAMTAPAAPDTAEPANVTAPEAAAPAHEANIPPAAEEAAAPTEPAAAEAPETLAAADDETTPLPEATERATEVPEAEPAPHEGTADHTEAPPAEAIAGPAGASSEAEASAEPLAPADADTQDEAHPDADVAAPDAGELPAQAPPIRLLAVAEAASQEFGLAAEEPAEVAAYQLPELELDITVPLAPAVATPRLPAFSGVPDVAYAPYEGSRYGFGLVTVAEVGEPPVPAASLPPAGEFFLPDALLLAHLAAPSQLPTNSTTDLINSFLRRVPAAPRRRAAPAPSSTQADLSVRSTRAAPDLASESLAKILARQGKVEQAIAVYERLMVKMPEKSAIFAAEIEALRPSA